MTLRPLRTRPDRGDTTARVVWARILLVLAAIFYCGVLTEALLGWPLDPMSTFLSELAARDQPTSELFRSLDVASALSALAGSALLRHHVVGRGLPWLLTFWGVIVLALATIADTALPLDCAVSFAECALREQRGDVSAAHMLHTVTSTIAGTAGMCVALGTVWVWWGARSTAVRTAIVCMCVVTIVATIVTTVTALLSLTVGIDQRVQVVGLCLLIAAAGWTLTGPARRDEA